MNIQVAPSVLAADFSRLAEEVEQVQDAGADLIHFDVMDGDFVPNITFGPKLVRDIRSVCRVPMDVHLMISEPERFIPDFIDAGADILTVHTESTPHAHRAIQMIREGGARVGVAINPGTSASALESVVDGIDLALVMTVNPGFGGQGFIESTLEKIRSVKKMLNSNQMLEVDGGIDPETAPLVVEAGANVLVAGTSVFGRKDYKKAIAELRQSKG